MDKITALVNLEYYTIQYNPKVWTANTCIFIDVRQKVKLSLFLVKHYTLKMDGKVKVWLQTFLISALHGGV
jgi:hypothetical protein